MRLWEHTGTIRSRERHNLHSDAPADPVRTMTVERSVRDDGRYLIYFSWPDAEADDAERQPEPDAPGADDV